MEWDSWDFGEFIMNSNVCQTLVEMHADEPPRSQLSTPSLIVRRGPLFTEGRAISRDGTGRGSAEGNGSPLALG